MDRGVRDRIMMVRVGKGMAALLLLALPLFGAGCHRESARDHPCRLRDRKSARANTPPTATDGLVPRKAGMPPGFPIPRPPPPWRGTSSGRGDRWSGSDGRRLAGRHQDGRQHGGRRPGGGRPRVDPAAGGEGESGVSPRTAAPPPYRRLRHQTEAARGAAPGHGGTPEAHARRIFPVWAKSPEELVYRVDFIGITMGYARFRYEGRSPSQESRCTT